MNVRKREEEGGWKKERDKMERREEGKGEWKKQREKEREGGRWKICCCNMKIPTEVTIRSMDV